MHRIGYHFPSSIVDRACRSLGVTLTLSGHVDKHQQNLLQDLPQDTRHPGKGVPTQLELQKSQAAIDTEAREAIKDLFPKIPKDEVHEIVLRAFEKV